MFSLGCEIYSNILTWCRRNSLDYIKLLVLLVQKVVGCGSEGCKDGSFTDCSFTSPQGLCQIGDVIYVADSHSHQIRSVSCQQYKSCGVYKSLYF